MFEYLLENIYIVSPKEHGFFPSSFCFYIDDDIKTLIDTPLDIRFINYFDNRPVDMILNTHFHRDHSGCNHLFPQAQIFAHPDDIPAMESQDVFSEYYGLRKYGDKTIEQGFLSWINWQPSHISGYFKEGDLINLGKTTLEVIHTPGHTPGHCALYWREKGILFAGDTDLTSFGPWYGNAVSDVDQVIASIHKIIDLKPRIILSGHKGMVSENVEQELQNYLQKVYANEEKILTALATPLTLEELANKKIIYGRWNKPENIYAFFEKVSLLNHLRRLQRLALVKFQDGKYHLK